MNTISLLASRTAYVLALFFGLLGWFGFTLFFVLCGVGLQEFYARYLKALNEMETSSV